MSTKTVQGKRQRFYLLDGLRLCAALAVVFYHYTAFGAHSVWGMPSSEKFPGLSHVTAFGALGVQLFFVISGFVIVLSAHGRMVRQFAASRISRLYPGYWVAVLAAAVLYLGIDRNGFKDVSASDAVVNLTMMQEAVGAKHLDGVYWTLWVGLLFYILIALIIPFGLTEGKIMALAFLWPVVGAMAKTAKVDLLDDFLNPTYAPFFAGGMVLYLIHAYGHSMMRWLLLGFNVCLGIRHAGAGWITGNIPDDTGIHISSVVGGASL